MLRLYPIPDGEPVSKDFSVKINGISADCYECRVSAMPFNRGWPGYERTLDQTEISSFISFDFDESVEIEITAKKEFSEAVIRPFSKNVKVETNGNNISFTISEPGQYSLELDGRHNNLHIFANSQTEYETGADTLYFGPGIHEIEKLELHSNQTVFIDSGAVVYAKTVRAYDCENISVIGHGILDFSKYQRTCEDPFVEEDSGSVTFMRCKDVLIDGITLRDATWWTVTAINCKNVRYNNVKVIGMWRYNSDGLDFVNSENVTVTNSFIRSFDDSIVLKGLNQRRNGELVQSFDYMNVRNYLVENCVVWCEWGGALEIGAETVADEYSDIIFRNCDIIRNADGAMRLNCGDRAVVHNVLYENINVEYSKYDRRSVLQKNDEQKYEPVDEPASPDVVKHRLWWGSWTPGSPNFGRIYDICYKNINIIADSGVKQPELHFDGASEERGISNVTFENLTFNGEKLTAENSNIYTNQFVKNITVK